MFKGVFQNTFANDQTDSHEDLTVQQKKQMINKQSFLNAIQLVSGISIVYLGNKLYSEFDQDCNVVVIFSGITIGILGIFGLIMYFMIKQELQEHQEQQEQQQQQIQENKDQKWYDTANKAFPKFLFIINNIVLLFLAANFLYQKFSYVLASYSFQAKYGEKEVNQLSEDYQQRFYFSMIFQIISMICMGYTSYSCHSLFKNNPKNTRDILYYYGIIFAGAIIGILYYNNEIMRQTRQSYFPSKTVSIDYFRGIQITSFIYLIGIMLTFGTNIAKFRNGYKNLSILFILVFFVFVSLNGQLYRSSYVIEEQYNSKQSCKKYIRWVDQQDLTTGGCDQKYTESVGPNSKHTLTCPQEDQIFTNLQEEKKLGVQACINPKCCGVLNILFTQNIIKLASLCVFIAGGSVLFIYSTNFLTNKYLQKSGPSLFEIGISILLIGLIVVAFFVSYSQFGEQIVIEEQKLVQNLQHNKHNLGNRKLYEEQEEFIQSEKNKNNNVHLSPIVKNSRTCKQFNDIIEGNFSLSLNTEYCESKDCQSEGIILGLMVHGGTFENMVGQNQKNLRFFDHRVAKIIFKGQIFEDLEEKDLENFDSGSFLAVQGDLDSVNQFLDNQLYACQTRPFQFAIKFVRQQIDLEKQYYREKNVQEIQEPVYKELLNRKQQVVVDPLREYFIYEIQIKLFDIQNQEYFQGKNVEVKVYQDIIQCRYAEVQSPLYSKKYQEFGQDQLVQLYNLKIGYYTVMVRADGYNSYCLNLNLEESDDGAVKNAFMVKKNQYRILLEWDNELIPLQLYLQASSTCYASVFNPSCEKVKFFDYRKQGIYNMQSIQIKELQESLDYLLFVNQYFDSEQKGRTEKIQKEDKYFKYNLPFLQTNARIIYYVPESNYPVKFMKIPELLLKDQGSQLNYFDIRADLQTQQKIEQEKNLAWLVFCIGNNDENDHDHNLRRYDKNRKDDVQDIQEFWIKNSDRPYIQKKSGELYPNNSLCKILKSWNN